MSTLGMYWFDKMPVRRFALAVVAKLPVMGEGVEAALDPVEWLPKVQARSIRLQDATFETNTPASSKTKLRAAVPARGTVVLYKTPEEFSTVVRDHRELVWIQQELHTATDSVTNAQLHQ